MIEFDYENMNITSKIIDNKRYYLLNTYQDKISAQTIASKYKYNSGLKHKRLARVLPLGREFALWVCPNEKKSRANR